MILHLHHVGLVVADISQAAGMYTNRLGYRSTSPVIHDPRQQARVQFLSLPGDAVLLELVEPDSPSSPLQAAVTKGHPLHHLCYSVAGIEKGCDDLRERGMTLICPPVGAVAFHNARVAWLMARDRVLVELVEAGASILPFGS